MKLTQLFSGEVRSEGRTQMTPAQAESMSRHMRSLVQIGRASCRERV